jgi:hypothetical protein
MEIINDSATNSISKNPKEITNIEIYVHLKKDFLNEYERIRKYLKNTCKYNDDSKIEDLYNKLYQDYVKETKSNLSTSKNDLHKYITKILDVIECLYNRHKGGFFSWIIPNYTSLNKRITLFIKNIKCNPNYLQNLQGNEKGICGEIIDKEKSGVNEDYNCPNNEVTSDVGVGGGYKRNKTNRNKKNRPKSNKKQIHKKKNQRKPMTKRNKK